MDLSSIITQVPNPSEFPDSHDRRAGLSDSEVRQDLPYLKTDAPVAGAVIREEETHFADNNNATDADGNNVAAADSSVGAVAAPTAVVVVTSPSPGDAARSGEADACALVAPPAGSLNMTTTAAAGTGAASATPAATAAQTPPSRQRTRSRARRSGFFRSFLCCFAGTPTEANGPPLEAETNGDLTSSRLLGAPRITDRDKKCFIIDLDETLVHSSFKPVENPDFIVPVEIDGTTHQVYVLKRPYVDEFLKRMGQLYECVLFTASLAKYADPVANLLDKWNVFRFRLFREACVFHRGNYVKDLGRLNRELHKVVILDNSPSSYMFHTDNAVQVLSWFDDREDRALLDLIPFFEALARADNVMTFLKHNPPPGLPSFAALGYPGQSLNEP